LQPSIQEVACTWYQSYNPAVCWHSLKNIAVKLGFPV
jgi:hypothetical protein